MHQAQEELLVLAAQSGNTEAFTYLCRHYQKAVTRFAYKLSSDPQIVHDAVQNAWLKLANNLHKLNDPRAFKSWLFKTVRWSVYDLMRAAKRDKEIIANDIDVLDIVASTKPESRDIGALIERLPDIDKQVIHLFYLEEMQLTQIAEVLEVPLGTVKSRLYRARKALQQSVEDEQDEY
ncbi:sigma-70 family RNA polymerase sigma factor [Pseudoalteromonas sp. MMG024]|uniref:RNA polymerase sigma factor n=1 Tax=Pseudoalteromonas sp. MMG024 TaxID=2909980 RepID=UPI001F029408|nr:sigma-70 family RNA polymerase sigma factor [Pseudoalteromonas sp. MMG024]MCF6458782.1 sigma-70 family RNA polymerase sigma factor [Pseudoalteromonas sp. MMG024]